MIMDNIHSLINESIMRQIGHMTRDMVSNGIHNSFSKYHGLPFIDKLHRFWEILRHPRQSLKIDKEITDSIDSLKTSLEDEYVKLKSYDMNSLFGLASPELQKLNNGQEYKYIKDLLQFRKDNPKDLHRSDEYTHIIKVMKTTIVNTNLAEAIKKEFPVFRTGVSTDKIKELTSYLYDHKTSEIVKEILSGKGDLKGISNPLINFLNHLDAYGVWATFIASEGYLINKAKGLFHSDRNPEKLPYSGSTKNNFGINEITPPIPEVSPPLLQTPTPIPLDVPITQPELNISPPDNDNYLAVLGGVAAANLGAYGAYKYLKNNKK